MRNVLNAKSITVVCLSVNGFSYMEMKGASFQSSKVNSDALEHLTGTSVGRDLPFYRLLPLLILLIEVYTQCTVHTPHKNVKGHWLILSLGFGTQTKQTLHTNAQSYLYK